MKTFFLLFGWALYLTRVNSINVQDKGLRIGGIGHRINSKVKISQTRRVSRINVVINLAYSQFVPDQPLLAPIYRWPGLKEPVGSDTYYNVSIRHGLVLRLRIFFGPSLTGLRGTQITGSISYTLVSIRSLHHVKLVCWLHTKIGWVNQRT
jgi:hypothetical protein